MQFNEVEYKKKMFDCLQDYAKLLNRFSEYSVEIRHTWVMEETDR